MELYVMRHGDWDFNPEQIIENKGVFQDPSLNAKGINRIKNVAEIIKKFGPEVIF